MFTQYYQCKRCFSLDMRIQLEKDGWRRGKQEIEKIKKNEKEREEEIINVFIVIFSREKRHWV